MEIVKQLEINGPPKSDPPKVCKPLDRNEKRANSKPSKSQVLFLRGYYSAIYSGTAKEREPWSKKTKQPEQSNPNTSACDQKEE